MNVGSLSKASSWELLLTLPLQSERAGPLALPQSQASSLAAVNCLPAVISWAALSPPGAPSASWCPPTALSEHNNLRTATRPTGRLRTSTPSQRRWLLHSSWVPSARSPQPPTPPHLRAVSSTPAACKGASPILASPPIIGPWSAPEPAAVVPHQQQRHCPATAPPAAHSETPRAATFSKAEPRTGVPMPRAPVKRTLARLFSLFCDVSQSII